MRAGKEEKARAPHRNFGQIARFARNFGYTNTLCDMPGREEMVWVEVSTFPRMLRSWELRGGRLNRTASVNYPRASALAAVPLSGYYTRAGQFLSQAVTVTSPVRPATSHN